MPNVVLHLKIPCRSLHISLTKSVRVVCLQGSILSENLGGYRVSSQRKSTGVDNRCRPILLTAAAASLALIPISSQIFWGPMAYAMIGGIIVGTLVTLVFVPALYLAVFHVCPVEDVTIES